MQEEGHAIIYGPAREILPRCAPNQISAILKRSRMRSFGKSGFRALSSRSSITPFKVMLEDTVFATARKKDIRLEPFPHLVIEEALDWAHYKRLLRTRPPYPGDPTASNRRLPISGWMLCPSSTMMLYGVISHGHTPTRRSRIAWPSSSPIIGPNTCPIWFLERHASGFSAETTSTRWTF